MRAFGKEGAGRARFSKGFSKKTFLSIGVARVCVGKPVVRIQFNGLPEPEHSFICSAGMKKGDSFLSVDEPGKGIEFPGARNLREGLLMSSGAREQDAVHPVSVGAILVQFQRLLNGSFRRCLGLRQKLVREPP